MNRTIVFTALWTIIIPSLFGVNYPLRIQDDSGFTLVLPSRPVKILSFTVFSDEVLFDLLPAERFAGVSALAVDPQVSNVAAKASQVRRRVEFTVEGVLAVQPDLVVVAHWSDQAKVQQIRGLGIPVYLVVTPLDVEGIRTQIRKLARLTDAERPGEQLVFQMEEKIQQLARWIRQRQGDKPVPRVLDYNTWGASSGAGTTWNTLVELAGLKNAVAGLKADAWGQVPVSKEVVVRENPDVLILPSWTYDEKVDARTFLDQVNLDPALKNTKALKAGRVYIFPEKFKSTVSHYLVDGARALAELVWK